MAEIVITVAGDDITEHVIYSDAEFHAAAKGRAGTAQFRIRDLEHAYNFGIGDVLTLDIDGIRKWAGLVAKVSRGYFFEVDCTCRVPITPRYLLIEAADYNTLFQKRVLYDKTTLTNMDLTSFPTGTSDQTVLLHYITNHTDLLADGITTNLIEHVDTPFVDAPVSGNASWQVGQFMGYLTRETGAIYYIDPDKAFVMTDVDTPNAPKGISDEPDATEVGCRDLEIDFDGTQLRNDALAWGAGQGSQAPVFSRVEDADSIAEHGRWQVGDFNGSVWHETTTHRIADSYVYGSPQNRRGGKDDRVSIKCTVFEPIFRVAQKVAFRSDVFGFSDVIPIRSEKITFDTPTDPRFVMTLGHDIDDPWTTVEYWFPVWDPPRWREPDFPDIWDSLPDNDSCAPGGCSDHFNRTTTNGLGESEFDGNTYVQTTFPYSTSGFRCTGSQAIATTRGSGDIYFDLLSVLSWIDLSPSLPFTYRILMKGLAATGNFYLDLMPSSTAGSSAETRPRLKVTCDATGIATITVQVINNQGTIHSTQSVATGGTGDDWIWVQVVADRTGAGDALLQTQAKYWYRGTSEPSAYQISAQSSLGTKPVVFTGWRFGTQITAFDGDHDFLALGEIHVDEGLACFNGDTFEETGDVIWDEDLTDLWTPHFDEFLSMTGDPGIFLPSFDGASIVEGQNTTYLPVNCYLTGPAGEATINRQNEGANYWEVRGDIEFLDLGYWAALNLVFSGEVTFQGFDEFQSPWNTGYEWTRHVYLYMVLNPTYPGTGSRIGLSANVASGGPVSTQITAQSVNFSWQENVTYHFRVRCRPNQATAKMWSEDEDEPGWMVGMWGSLAPLIPQFIIEPSGQTLGWVQGRPIQVLVKNLAIGVEAIDRCGENHSPDAPCAGRYMCETISPLVLGQSYQTTYEWIPGTDEVWADGLRIDHRDYTPNPVLRTIILNEPLVNPSAEIYMCYHATCIGED